MYHNPSSGITNRLYIDFYMGSGGPYPGPHTCTGGILHISNLQGAENSHTTTVCPSLHIK